jgi:hypothetical protein
MTMQQTAPAMGAPGTGDLDPVEVLGRGLAFYRDRYVRTAFMIAKKGAGLAGMNDDIPAIEDLTRARLYYEEIAAAYDLARRSRDGAE